jgi:hypothetical protein
MYVLRLFPEKIINWFLVVRERAGFLVHTRTGHEGQEAGE